MPGNSIGKGGPNGTGDIMHAKRVLWLDFDLGSLALLVIGTSAVAVLAFSGF